MWPYWSVFYDGHWKRVTARHLWSAFSFWCLCCVMRWFLIIANFMALQAVLILLGVPLPILSSRRVFEQLSAPDLTSYSLSLSVLLCGYFSLFFTDFLWLFDFVYYRTWDHSSSHSMYGLVCTCCQFRSKSFLLCFILSTVVLNPGPHDPDDFACLCCLTHLIQITSSLEETSVNELCSDWHGPYTVGMLDGNAKMHIDSKTS